jgi:D-tyrosyl-tRNA(Tyr) deacylase
MRIELLVIKRGNNNIISKMKIVLQRVSSASVTIDTKIVADIQKGLLVLVGIEDLDNQEDINWLASKIANIRIFGDENDVMNLSVKDIDGDIIVVSQFTLHAATKKGNRPSYIKASKPEIAIPLYESFVLQLEKELGKKVQTGIFGADMKVLLLNDGPVTIVIDSKNKE